MKIAVALCTLLLGACTQAGDIASASALPAYNVAAQAALDRVATMKPSEIAALKIADAKAYPAVLVLDDAQHARAAALHARIQALGE